MVKELKLYLPIILQDIAEYDALSSAETPILEDIEEKTNRIVEDSFLTTMSEARLAEWEKALGIIPSEDSLEQRRSVVLARFRGTGKLNKSLIEAMVGAFTGGTASVTFADGIISVKVAPPSSTFNDFSLEKLTDELAKRKPAHLLLNIELAYITWEQVKNNFSSWGEIRESFTDWEEFRLYYTSQEAYSLWR
jgi:hypothetical protein